MSQEPFELLVRADDIGFSHAANEACMAVFTHGICRSVELMAPCPWFPEAVKLLQAQPNYDVGVHFTLTSEWDNVKWGPLSDAKSLVNDDGYFYRAFRKSDHYPPEAALEAHAWTPEDVEMELRAQIERVLKYIPWASHLTTHMGGLRDDPNYQNVVDRVGAQYNLNVDVRALGYERFRGFGENNQALSPAEKVMTLRQNLADLAPGKWMFVDHPAYDTPESRAVHHIGYEGVAVDRQGVVDAWTDAEVLAIIARRGIRLVSYADVKSGAAS